MKTLFFVLSLLFLASCAETNITPTPPDANASSARKNFYSFSPLEKGIKPYALNLKDANIYLIDDYSNLKIIMITDGVMTLLPSGFYSLVNPTGATNDENAAFNYAIYLTLYGPDGSLQPGNFLMDKLNYSSESYLANPYVYTVPMVTFQVDDRTNLITDFNGDHPRFNHTYEMQDVPGYVNKDDYLNITGNIADRQRITVSFSNADMIMSSLYDNGFFYNGTYLYYYWKQGIANFQLSGLVDATYVDMSTGYSRISGSNLNRFSKAKFAKR